MLALISLALLLVSFWPQSTATNWGITGPEPAPDPEPEPDPLALSSPDSTSTKRLLARRFNILISSTRANSIQSELWQGDRRFLSGAPRNYASVTNKRKYFSATAPLSPRSAGRKKQKSMSNDVRTREKLIWATGWVLWVIFFEFLGFAECGPTEPTTAWELNLGAVLATIAHTPRFVFIHNA